MQKSQEGWESVECTNDLIQFLVYFFIEELILMLLTHDSFQWADN